MEHLYEARILLVDDNPDILEMLKNILARRGFQNVRTASDCRSARLVKDYLIEIYRQGGEVCEKTEEKKDEENDQN